MPDEPELVVRTREIHVVPPGDLVEHDCERSCACGPTVTSQFLVDGSIGWSWQHHALDGRPTPGEDRPSLWHLRWPRSVTSEDRSYLRPPAGHEHKIRDGDLPGQSGATHGEDCR